ncbi:uncharacterized protein EDB91DRAFT_1174344 [Suillus paluster]|uniref:uncharacterized protein n=1 Tax=Suillus paluster TaxID=48578 RepID=UPI001B8683A7|nr:uncharacterized protein EDB91DRAFT_1174344 [Suillus paluster]KAG1722695.1 hypothetical protein EDB91DRAFT_1174344 [Suillus paluster]
MFTSRSIMFALFSFLAGANACIQCPPTLQVDGSTSTLAESFPLGDHKHLFCVYNNDKLKGYDASVSCEYDIANGRFSKGYESCEAKVTVKDHC